MDINSAAVQLRILSLNVWGLKYVSARRKERIRAIAEYICGNGHDDEYASHPSYDYPSPTTSSASQSDSENTPLRARSTTTSAAGHSRWDVVCLQELWCSEDWIYLRNRVKESGSGLVHGRYFYSGALGSGLCILSKYPIVATSTWPYSLNGSPLHVIEGDFYVAKACGQATLDFGPNIGNVTVLNTHFFAPGGEYGEEWKRSHRLAQAWELARLTNVAAERGQHVFVCGDLNSIPTSLVINLLLSHGRLSDSWAVCHPPASDPISSSHLGPTAEEAIIANGITCDNPLNTFSAAKKFGDDVVRAKGKRLDYILFRRPDRMIREKKWDVQAVECSVTAKHVVKGLGCSLSDHFGIESLFTFSETDREMGESIELIPPRPPSLQVLTLARAAITIYSSRSSKSASFQLSLFLFSLLGIPVLSVAASFQPIKWLNWIFVLLGIANGVGGATMLYTGFVGGRWEKSALQNVLADMQIEMDRLEGKHIKLNPLNANN